MRQTMTRLGNLALAHLNSNWFMKNPYALAVRLSPAEPNEIYTNSLVIYP